MEWEPLASFLKKRLQCPTVAGVCIKGAHESHPEKAICFTYIGSWQFEKDAAKKNCSTEICCVSETGLYLRRIPSCITQLKAPGPAPPSVNRGEHLIQKRTAFLRDGRLETAAQGERGAFSKCAL